MASSMSSSAATALYGTPAATSSVVAMADAVVPMDDGQLESKKKALDAKRNEMTKKRSLNDARVERARALRDQKRKIEDDNLSHEETVYSFESAIAQARKEFKAAEAKMKDNADKLLALRVQWDSKQKDNAVSLQVEDGTPTLVPFKEPVHVSDSTHHDILAMFDRIKTGGIAYWVGKVVTEKRPLVDKTNLDQALTCIQQALIYSSQFSPVYSELCKRLKKPFASIGKSLTGAIATVIHEYAGDERLWWLSALSVPSKGHFTWYTSDYGTTVNTDEYVGHALNAELILSRICDLYTSVDTPQQIRKRSQWISLLGADFHKQRPVSEFISTVINFTLPSVTEISRYSRDHQPPTPFDNLYITQLVRVIAAGYNVQEQEAKIAAGTWDEEHTTRSDDETTQRFDAMMNYLFNGIDTSEDLKLALADAMSTKDLYDRNELKLADTTDGVDRKGIAIGVSLTGACDDDSSDEDEKENDSDYTDSDSDSDSAGSEMEDPSVDPLPPAAKRSKPNTDADADETESEDEDTTDAEKTPEPVVPFVADASSAPSDQNVDMKPVSKAEMSRRRKAANLAAVLAKFNIAGPEQINDLLKRAPAVAAAAASSVTPVAAAAAAVPAVKRRVVPSAVPTAPAAVAAPTPVPPIPATAATSLPVAKAAPGPIDDGDEPMADTLPQNPFAHAQGSVVEVVPETPPPVVVAPSATAPTAAAVASLSPVLVAVSDRAVPVTPDAGLSYSQLQSAASAAAVDDDFCL